MMNSGTEEIRRALYSRNKKVNLAGLARDLGVPSSALEDFIRGRDTLAADILQALATYVWGGAAEYVPAIDKLRAVKQVPRSMGVKPEPLEPWQLPTYTAGPPQAAPGMVSPPQPKAKRAGWVE